MTVGLDTTPDLSALREQCGGAVLLPGDDGYDPARRVWNLAVHQRPAAVAYPADADEVAALVRCARAAGLRIAVQATGHHAGTVGGSLEDAILLRTSALRGVQVDPVRRIARAGAGALWQDVVAATREHGLTALHGSAPDVGVAGYTLGGGMGWRARRHGLQCNQLVAAELVTAKGEIVRTDAEHDPELFWALRGGGGSFGVVTALELALLPLETVYAGMLAWDASHAARVLARWSEWAAGAPEDVTTSARLVRLPWLSRLPETLRGRQLVNDRRRDPRRRRPRGRAAAAPARSGARAGLLRPSRCSTLLRRLGDIDRAAPVMSDHVVLDRLDGDVISTLVAAAEPGSPFPLRSIELRQLGGALARREPGAGALGGIDGAAVLYAAGTAENAPQRAAVAGQLARIKDAMSPWSGGAVLNFAEGAADPSTAFAPAAFRRLRAVRSRVDPDGVFAAGHAIPAAA
jgi:FAD/FMN-containing dehydrogenase